MTGCEVDRVQSSRLLVRLTHPRVARAVTARRAPDRSALRTLRPPDYATARRITSASERLVRLLGRFPSMAVVQEQLAAILFVVAMVGIALGMLLALFLMFRHEQQGMKKPAKSFLLSNWK